MSERAGLVAGRPERGGVRCADSQLSRWL